MSQEDLIDTSAQPGGDPLENTYDSAPQSAAAAESGMQAPEPGIAEPKPEPVAPKPPSRMSRFFRKVMLYSIGVLCIFLVGYITAFYLQVIPARQSEGEARAAVSAEIEALQAEIAEGERHFHLMNALVDVYSAQVALVAEDSAGVRAALAGTDDRLQLVEETQEDDSANALAALRTQLSTVLASIDDNDLVAAGAGLERLASNLLALERSMFGE
ncbi:MAG: hypothetical protein JXA97_03150 [Anaerolineales bacterium]|nr:hypothetical protein [Anaerolineales bacterium]